MFPFMSRPNFSSVQPNLDPTRNMMRNVSIPDDDGQDDPYGNLNQPQQSQEDPNGFMSVYRELMQRRNGPAMTAYRKFLDTGYPDERDSPPGKLTRLAAILSGTAAGFANPGSGTGVAQNILDQPYQRKVRQYAAEGNRLANAASFEETQSKDNIAAVKAIGDLQDKETDNKRQQALADSTIATNAARAKAAGNKVIHADDGHVYVFDNDNKKTDLGKLSETPDEKSARTIKQAVGIAQQEAPIKVKQAVDTAKGISPIIEGRETRLEGTRQANRVSLEGTRQADRMALRDKSIKASMDRLEARLNQKKDPSVTQKIKLNTEKLRSVLDSDPSRYENFWDDNKGELKAPPDINSPEYQDFVKLYNTLYDGISTLSAKPTKAGNKIVR